MALLFAALGTLFTFLMTALGAATVFFLRSPAAGRAQSGFLGFAAGVMTAASVWSLLLPALDAARGGTLPPWLPAALGFLLGALFLAGLGALPAQLRPGGDEMRTALLISAITLHNIPEGMAVGLAFALAASEAGGDGLYAAAALALGIGVQNFPEGAAISLPLRAEGHSRRKAFLVGTLSGAAEPLFGVPVVLLGTLAQPLMPWLLGFAAGAMLCVVVGELIPQAEGRGGTCGFLVGFLLMMILDTAL